MSVTATSFQALSSTGRNDLLALYHKARSCFWTEDEILYASDIPDYEALKPYERHFIELVLAFFAVSDRIVLSNLVENFIQEIDIPEAKLFYNFQAVIEDIHSMTYTSHLETLVKDTDRQHKLLRSVEHFASIEKKVSWALKWMNRSASLSQRIVAFAIVEAIYFSASFCSIFWLKAQNKFVKGIGTSNEFISRDEALHAEFACTLYRNYFPALESGIIEEMIREAVDVEGDFVDEALPGEGFVGMTSSLMKDYVRFVADKLAKDLGVTDVIFGNANPFPFMSNLSLPGKTNFFEKRVTEYAKVNVSTNSLEDLNDF